MTGCTFKPKTCKVCNEEYIPRRPLQVVCDLKCALEDSRRKREKQLEKDLCQKEAAKKQYRAAWRQKNKSLTKLKGEAQSAVNAYVRARDHGKPCISCGITEAEVVRERNGGGGYWDAGHYLSRGAHPELRYNTLNIHKQCKQCNGGSRSKRFQGRNPNEATIRAAYRAELINRIGAEKVEWLEGPHPSHKPSREYLERLKKIFNKRARHYRKLRDM